MYRHFTKSSPLPTYFTVPDRSLFIYIDTFCNAVDCRFELALEVRRWTIGPVANVCRGGAKITVTPLDDCLVCNPGPYCNATWDKFKCWPATPANTTVIQPCPPIFGPEDGNSRPRYRYLAKSGKVDVQRLFALPCVTLNRVAR